MNANPWDSEAVAAEVQNILDALEAPPIDEATRSTLRRYLWRRQKHGDQFCDEWGTDGRGYITLLVRTIVESEGNRGALSDPVVKAVSSCMRPIWTRRGLDWLAAFDAIPLVGVLNELRSLDLFNEEELPVFYQRSIMRRLWQTFGPDVTARPAPAKAKATKLPARLTRIPIIERRIALGLQLLELKVNSRRNNDFSILRKKQFGDIEPKLATQAAAVAKRYGSRPEIFQRVGWQTLVQLSSPSLSTSARMRFEARILAGEDIRGIAVKQARGRQRSGRPARQEKPAERMAA